MSYFMCSAARLSRTGEGKVLVEMAGRDNNMVPFRGDARLARQRFHRVQELDPADAEAAAEWAEGMARCYDGGSTKEDGRWIPGDEAYRLWAGRLARAGIAIRAPRLSRIFYGGPVPPNFAGATRPTDRALRVRKGQGIDRGTASRLAAIGVDLRVSLPQSRTAGRLIRDGAPDRFFVLAPRKRRRGWRVGAEEPIVAEEGFSGEAHWRRANPYGGPIPFEALCQADAARRDGVALCGGAAYIATDYGQRQEGACPPVRSVPLGAMRYEHGPIAVFSGPAAAEMLSRLRRHIPEIAWEMRPCAAVAREIIAAHPELAAARGDGLPDGRARAAAAPAPAGGEEVDL